MTLRDKFAEIIGGRPYAREIDKLKSAMIDLNEAYLTGPFIMPPDKLLEQLREYDSAAVNDLVIQLGYDRLSGMGYGLLGESQRKRQVDESRRLWQTNPLSWWVIQVWTFNGLGEGVKVRPNDENAIEICDAAWLRSPIFADDCIHDLGRFLNVEGSEFIVAYVATLDGSVTFRRMDFDEITEIVTDPDDKTCPLYYKREYIPASGATSKTIYYPDWEAYYADPSPLSRAVLPSGANKAEEVNKEIGDGKTGTIALMLHIAHNRKDPKSLWGYPVLGITAPYMRSQKQFMENRLTMAAARASFQREYITKSGSRGVAAIKAKLASTLSMTNYTDTNPPPVAAALIHNDNIEHRDVPLTTGAADADTDWKMFTQQALIGGGLFPTSAGMDTSRWATAVAMDKTQSAQWKTYQNFWAAQFKKMVKIVLRSAEQFNGQSFDDYGAQVSIDSLSLVDLPGVVDPIAQMVSTLGPLVDNGTLEMQAARGILQNLWNIILQAVGVDDPEKVTSDELFGILTDEQRAQAGQANHEMSEMAWRHFEKRLSAAIE